MFIKQHTNVRRNAISIILTARKSIIKFDNKLWARKDSPGCFDITMALISTC